VASEVRRDAGVITEHERGHSQCELYDPDDREAPPQPDHALVVVPTLGRAVPADAVKVPVMVVVLPAVTVADWHAGGVNPATAP